MKTNNELAKNTLILTIGTLCAKVTQFILIPFITAWVTTEEYGLFDLWSTYVTLAIPFVTMATGEAIFRYVIECDDLKKRKSYLSSGMFFVVINYVLAMMLVLIITRLMGVSLVQGFILLMFTQLMNTYLQANLRAMKMLKVYTKSNILLALMQIVGCIFFLWYFNMGLSGLMYMHALSYLIADVYIFVQSRLKDYLTIQAISFEKWKVLVGYSAPLIPNDLSWWVLNVSDRQIINIYLGDQANGVYALACKIPSICVAIFGMFSISWQQQIVGRINDEDCGEYANGVLKEMVQLLLSIGIGILSVTPFLYKYIFVDKYVEGMTQVPILLAGVILASLMQFFGGIQIALKRPKENGFTTVVGAIVNIVVHLVLVNYIGLFAASISTMIANSVVVVLRWIKLRDFTHFHIPIQIYAYIAIYVYYAVSMYLEKNDIFFSVNAIVAIVVCVYMNKSFLRLLMKKCVDKTLKTN